MARTRFFGVCLSIGLALAASGCGAGIAGAVLGILSMSGNSGTSSDLPPVLMGVTVSAPVAPDRIHVDFRIGNEDGGRLGARIEFVKIREGPGGPEPDGLPATVTPLPGSMPLEDVRPEEAVHFIWDAKTDLGGGCALVQLVLIPVEDGLDGKPFTTEAFRAGNTPPVLEGALLGSQAHEVLVSFQVIDAESDMVTLEAVEVAGDEGVFHPLPSEIFDRLIRRFPGAPGPQGASGSIHFDVRDLDRPEVHEDLRRIGAPGFVGRLSVRLAARDFPSEEPSTVTGSFTFDNNEPPIVEMLSISSEDLAGAVVPIRYRLFDRDRNTADLRIEVDLGDGQGFRPAHEFPSDASEGSSGLATLDPMLFGNPENPFHTFLWDAGSQVGEGKDVAFALTAFDREEGPRNFLRIGALPAPGLVKVGELETKGNPWAFTVGDFDADGFPDAVVLNNSSEVTCLRGGPGGLSRVGEIVVSQWSRSLASGDFDGDRFTDVVVATGTNLVVLQGSNAGLSKVKTFGEVNCAPEAMTAGDFDGDAFPDVVMESLCGMEGSKVHRH